MCHAPAQSWSIPRFNIDSGGGGASTGGLYSVTFRIGQPAAGTTMTNQHYSMTAGFLKLLAVIQTPGAPLLSITQVGTNAVIGWSNAFLNWALEEGVLFNSWSTVSLPRSTNSGQISVSVPLNAVSSVFRLKKL